MQKFLAVAVLGASLAFASGAAFAEDRGVVEPVFQPVQSETIIYESQTDQSTVAGGSPVSEVDTSRENDGIR